MFDEPEETGSITAEFKINAVELKIVLTPPTEDDNYEVEELKVFACFVEEYTTVTTAPTGTTTEISTTTKFTSSGTTVTTVISTLTPDTTSGIYLHF